VTDVPVGIGNVDCDGGGSHHVCQNLLSFKALFEFPGSIGHKFLQSSIGGGDSSATLFGFYDISRQLFGMSGRAGFPNSLSSSQLLRSNILVMFGLA